jgi:histidinol-phosphate aminotransferase
MIVKTVKSFNQFTRHALSEKVAGYVNKSKSLEEEVVRLKKRYNLQKIYRFDLGENVDGFSPKINEFLENLYKNEVLFSKLHQYPDITHLSLRERIGAIFNIPRQQIVISAGLDSILDLITRAFFEYRDVFIMPVPGFFLFESYSERMGATPVFLQLDEESNFEWTPETFEKLKDLIVRFRPKIVWLSNPNNPTGNVIPESMLKEVLDLTYAYNIYIVLDEAYHDFVGKTSDSAAKYLKSYQNLMVLRSFSKAHGLAGIRLGYIMCSNEEIIEALLIHRHHFPITQLSMNIARIALKDRSFINQTQNNTRQRRNILFNLFDTLPTFKYIPSQTNIFMLRNNFLTANELDVKLKKYGIVTSQLNITGLAHNKYLRITIRTESDNYYFFNACKEINNELQHLS